MGGVFAHAEAFPHDQVCQEQIDDEGQDCKGTIFDIRQHLLPIEHHEPARHRQLVVPERPQEVLAIQPRPLLPAARLGRDVAAIGGLPGGLPRGHLVEATLRASERPIEEPSDRSMSSQDPHI